MNIKFRGKTKEGNWIVGYYAKNMCGEECIVTEDPIPVGNNTVSRWHEVIPSSVGQWTGLQDKNKVDIYCGDFLRSKFWNSMDIDIVREIKYEAPEWEGFRFGTRGYEWEVIGNTTDNPELGGEE